MKTLPLSLLLFTFAHSVFLTFFDLATQSFYFLWSQKVLPFIKLSFNICIFISSCDLLALPGLNLFCILPVFLFSDGLQNHIPLGSSSLFRGDFHIHLWAYSCLKKEWLKFGKESDRFLRIIPCREDGPVCSDESSDPEGPFCYFYAIIFKKDFPPSSIVQLPKRTSYQN